MDETKHTNLHIISCIFLLNIWLSLEVTLFLKRAMFAFIFQEIRYEKPFYYFEIKLKGKYKLHFSSSRRIKRGSSPTMNELHFSLTYGMEKSFMVGNVKENREILYNFLRLFFFFNDKLILMIIIFFIFKNIITTKLNLKNSRNIITKSSKHSFKKQSQVNIYSFGNRKLRKMSRF